MALGIVQSTALQKLAGGTSQTYSLTGVGANNTLAITIAYGAASTNTAQATYPANWIVTSIKSQGGGGRADVAVLPGNYVAGGAESATITFPSGTYATGEMHEVSGLNPTSPVDLQLTIANTAASIVPTATNHTTAQASEIIFGVAATDPYYGSGTQTCTQPTGYTQLWQETNANSYAVGVGAYKILSAITTVTDAWSVPSGSYDYAVAVSLKAASGGSFSQSISGSITPTGSTTLAVRVAVVLSGSLTVTGAIAKRTAISLAGAVAAAGTLGKRTGKALIGSVTGSGSLKRSTSTTLSGSTIPTGTLSETAVLQKVVSGAITLSTTIATVLIHGGGAAKRAMTQIALFLGIRL